ncbi:hypothetical protein SH449x_002862 [Pirellulaceae bacterium SH449]
MTTIAEIEKAIEQLPLPQIEELARWLDDYRSRRSSPADVETWLTQARGASQSGVTTADVMTLTRGEE